MFKFLLYCYLLGTVISSIRSEENGQQISEDKQPKNEEEVVVAHHTYESGTREELDTNLEALKNMAYIFLPLTLDYKKVSEAHREIVDGVKFDIIVETKDNHDETVICQLIVKEKPWLENHDRLRELEYSNCSLPHPIDIDAVNRKYPDNTIFNRYSTYEGDLINLEGQIMPPKRKPQKPSIQSSEAPKLENVPVEETVSAYTTVKNDVDIASPHSNDIPKFEEQGLNTDVQSALDELFLVNLPVINPTPESDSRYGEMEEVTEDIIIASKVTPKVTAVEEIDKTESHANENQPNSMNQDVLAQLDSLFNVQINNNGHNNNPNDYYNGNLQEPYLEQVQVQRKPCPPQIDTTFADFEDDVQQRIMKPDDIDYENINQNKQKRQTTPAPLDVINVAEKALQHLDSVDSDENKRLLMSIKNYKILESPYMKIYYITLMYSDTYCSEDAFNSSGCKSRLMENSKKICNIEVEVSSETGVVKLTKSGCGAAHDRLRREERPLGAPEPIKENDELEEAKKLAEESLASYSAAGDGRDYKLKNIMEASKQVVAGVLYKIRGKIEISGKSEVECFMEIWTRDWVKENGTELTLTCGEEEPVFHRYRRSVDDNKVALRGGPRKITDPRELEKVKQIAEESLASYTAAGEGRDYKLKEIIEATKQVVEGLLYKVKGKVVSGTNEIDCSLEIWTRSWLENGNELTMTCGEEKSVKHRYRRQLGVPGGVSPITDENELQEVKQLTEQSLASYSAAGDGRDYKLKAITKATRQVVAGALYKIEGKVIISGNTEVDCLLEIWTQPWLKKDGTQLTMTCGEEKAVVHRYRRSAGKNDRPLLGGPQKITDPSELAEVKQLAEQSLASYSAAGDGRNYKLKEITEATRQVVAGTLYKVKSTVVISENTEVDCLLEIWTQPWLEKDGNQLTMTCGEEKPVVHRYKRQLGVPGGVAPITDQNELQEVKQLTEQSLASYSAAGDGRDYKLKEITKATRQVVAGTLYKIEGKFLISGNTEVDCLLEIWTQPWLKKDGTQLTIKCGEEKAVVHRYRRSAGKNDRSLLGGPQKITDPSELAEVKQLAEQSLASYSAAGDGRNYKLKEIMEATRQVVAGTLYKVKSTVVISENTEVDCLLEIWTQPWLEKDGNQLTMTCGEEKPVVHRYKRQLGVPGGVAPITDQNELQEVKQLTEQSLASYSAAGDGRDYKLKEITKATRQVVAGTLYKIEGKFLISGNTEVDCLLEIWTQPWLKKDGTQLTIKCGEEKAVVHRYRRSAGKNDRPLLGGPQKITDPSELAEVKQLAEQSLASYSAAGDGRNYKLKEIMEATRQVVAGTLYKVKSTVVISENTEVDCLLEIWTQPWLEKDGNQLTMTCGEEKPVVHRYKRQLGVPGGVAPITDQNELQEVKQLTEQSLASYSASGDGRDYKLKEITKATRQVVAGTLYKIEGKFLISGNTEVDCLLEIWTQPWLKKDGTQLTMKCGEEKPVVHRYRRGVGGIRGGLTPITESSDLEKVKQLADQSLASYSAAGDGRDYKLKEITEATKQVVAGTLYKVKGKVVISESTEVDCLLEIWTQPWLEKDGTQLTMTCGEEKPVVHRYKRQLGVPGGVSTITDHSELQGVKQLAEESLASYSATGSGRDYKLKEITKATRQVVAGTLYKIEGKFLLSGNTEVDCLLEIWTQPWLKKDGTQLTIKCGEEKPVVHRYRRGVGGIRGGLTPITDSNELEKVKQLAEQSLASYSAAGDGRDYKLKEIKEATRQVVSGALYKVKGKVVISGNTEVDCILEIWTQPWLEKDGTQLTMRCGEEEPVVHRYRREITKNFNAHKKLAKKSRHLFSKFMFKYNRKYENLREEKQRYAIFKKNLAIIDQLNAMEQGTAIYGITDFADMTIEEYRLRTGLIPRAADENHIPNPIAEIPDIELPKEFDWREKGAVSEVKNQGGCGSCWAFSVTGNIEGLHAIKTGKLEEYSEQELLDCDSLDNACSGGLPDNAYKAIEEIGGLELESDYPYQARKNSCKLNKTMVHVRVKGAVDLPKDETAMAKYLVANGPLSIGINANAMQFYRGGISHPWRLLCRKGGIDHGVLIVGYGVAEYPVFNKTIPFWTVKNSWGSKWGEQGYYRVYRGDNTCGINSMASSAVLAD